ncbi:MAG TPA: zf-HC2 domain-containing protein [Solirubrobacteraceae bacterium]|jgi:anti-sigma factor RsiW
MSAYLDSELRARARARLEDHTADCPQCRRVLAELQTMLGLLRSAPPPELFAGGPAITTAVLRRLHEPVEH